MPTLNDPRHEQFAQLVASGKTLKESYSLSGYQGKGAAQSANRLNKEPRVSARILELRLLAQQIPLASSWLNENFVLQGLKDVFQKAMKLEKLSDAVSALNLMGKRLGLFVDRVDTRVRYPENISELSEIERATVMRWLAHMAYPDDPAAAEAALQMPSGHEVIDIAPVQGELSAAPTTVECEKPNDGNKEIQVSRSWADLEEDERTRLAEEWREKGPALPEGLTLEEMVVWLDRFWPLSVSANG